jgi:feruloyl-CoA synthase
MFAPVGVLVERRADGACLVRCEQPLAEPARCVGAYLEHWAQAAPERAFLVERARDGHWRELSYGQALQRVYSVAAWLLEQRLSEERPVAILSENSIEHALLSLACLHVGIPVAPISPAYSLLSKDFGKLKACIGLLRPGVIYVADETRFREALNAIAELHDAEIVVATDSPGSARVRGFDTLMSTHAHASAVSSVFAALTPDSIAKFLFTSGSTGEPKAVINTQRMLCSNQRAIAQIWPFIQRTPVLLDWLPWHHTFGGNHNFNVVLANGGTLYIDGGRPLPREFEQTLANLAEVSPTVFFNVPRAYEMLVAALRSDPVLRTKFFSRLELIFYAAASLPQHLWEALESLSLETLGRKLPMVSSWGLTETSPALTNCYSSPARSGVVGLPLPGSELKLSPNGDKLEARVKGPNVTPGYWRRPDLTASAFDAEGYLVTGDALRFVDGSKPELGLFFDGRVGEDFKLSTGTRVSVGTLRLEAIAALGPIAQDVVVTGHDRNEIGLLIFPNLEACRRLCEHGQADVVPVSELVQQPAIRAQIERGLAALKAKGKGSSTYATRALVLTEPPSVDAGEITDKGYINQRAVLTRRAARVADLYRSAQGIEIVALPRESSAPSPAKGMHDAK